jgi:tRNA (mo5U34)-methyltransferase
LRGGTGSHPLRGNYSFWQNQIFFRDDFPRLHFIEKCYAGDPTNWWIPNNACLEAMIRSARFEILSHPEQEVYVCRVTQQDDPESRTSPYD